MELKFLAVCADSLKLNGIKYISIEGGIMATKNIQSASAKVKPMKEQITEKLVKECKEKLLKTKMDLMNRAKEAREKLDLADEKGGDEADQTVRLMAEQEMLTLNDRLRSQLFEIESALGRIESGAYGLCEETDEPIEAERLRAIPWTRLSIEGAEIRESMNKRYAR